MFILILIVVNEIFQELPSSVGTQALTDTYHSIIHEPSPSASSSSSTTGGIGIIRIGIIRLVEVRSIRRHVRWRERLGDGVIILLLRRLQVLCFLHELFLLCLPRTFAPALQRILARWCIPLRYWLGGKADFHWRLTHWSATRWRATHCVGS